MLYMLGGIEQELESIEIPRLWTKGYGKRHLIIITLHDHNVQLL